MKWRVPSPGDTRTRTKFLWFPKAFTSEQTGETYKFWLAFFSYEEEYMHFYNGPRWKYTKVVPVVFPKWIQYPIDIVHWCYNATIGRILDWCVRNRRSK